MCSNDNDLPAASLALLLSTHPVALALQNSALDKVQCSRAVESIREPMKMSFLNGKDSSGSSEGKCGLGDENK